MAIVGEGLVAERVYRSAISRLNRSYFRRIRVVGAVLAVIGVILFAVDPTGVGAVGVGLALGGTALAAFLPYVILWQSARLAAPAIAAPWRYEIGEDVIRVSTPLASTERRWQAFTTAQEHQEFWLLHTAIKGVAVILVKNAFTAADQLALAQLIQGLGLAEHVAPTVVM